MGNKPVEYDQQSRDGNKFGTRITDPKEYFKRQLFDLDGWTKTMKQFAEMPPELQTKFKAVFGEDNAGIFVIHQDAAGWFAVHEDDGDLADKMN